MAPTACNTSCRAGLGRVGLFVVGIIMLGLTFSACVKPWIDLSWWKVFRRCVSVSAGISLWVIVTQLEKRSLRSYGFLNRTTGTRQLLRGVGIGATCLVALFTVGLLFGFYRLNVIENHTKLWLTIVGFVPAALLIGVLEELVFRGFLLQQLMSCSKPFAVLVSTVAYSLVHLRTRTLSLSTGLELGGLCLLGGILVLSYFRTQQLYFAVGLHAVLAYGAIVNKLFIACSYPSLSWFVGTNRLINGILGWCALLGIGIVIARWRETSHQGG